MSTTQSKSEASESLPAVLLAGSLAVGFIVFAGFASDAFNDWHHQRSVAHVKTITCTLGGREHDYGPVTHVETNQDVITFKDSADITYEAPRSACIVASAVVQPRAAALPGPHRHFSQDESKQGAQIGDVWETDTGQYVLNEKYEWAPPR